MDTRILHKSHLFLPWQDEKEEAWLEEMSLNGWHLSSVQLFCSYTFTRGDPRHYIYRLDYQNAAQEKLADYLQIFRDAGWEYLGELSNWRYWRRPVAEGETAEIFTDRDSKVLKYRRILGVMVFFLFFLIFMGSRLMGLVPRLALDLLTPTTVIYLAALILYAVLILIYILVVVQLLRRIKQLKRKNLS